PEADSEGSKNICRPRLAVALKAGAVGGRCNCTGCGLLPSESWASSGLPTPACHASEPASSTMPVIQTFAVILPDMGYLVKRCGPGSRGARKYIPAGCRSRSSLTGAAGPKAC